MESLAFFFFTAIFATEILVFLRKKNRKLGLQDYIDPATIFSAGFFVYSIVGVFDRIGHYSNELIIPIKFYFAAILGFAAFSFGYISCLKKQEKETLRSKLGISVFPHILNDTRIKVSDLLMLIILLLFVVVNIDDFRNMFIHFGAGLSYVDNSLRESRTMFSGAKSLWNSFFGVMLIGYPVYRIYKSGKVSPIPAILLIVYSVFCLTSGYRTQLITIIIAFLALINNKIRRLSFKDLMLVGIPALLFLVALGHLRARSSVSGMIEMFKENGLHFLRLDNSGEFYNTVGTTFSYIEAAQNGNYMYNLGYSWIVELAMFIPTFLWPTRPIPLPEKYMSDFFPEALAGTGKGWFIMTDGYMSFGIAGIMIEFFIIGVVLAKSYNYFMNRKNNAVLFVIYTFMLSFVFTMIRSSFFGAVKNYILEILPFILIYFVSKKYSNQETIKFERMDNR